jgi:hypothetical protein
VPAGQSVTVGSMDVKFPYSKILATSVQNRIDGIREGRWTCQPTSWHGVWALLQGSAGVVSGGVWSFGPKADVDQAHAPHW